MPPLLMTALFSLVLSLVAPHSNVALPLAHGVSKIDQQVVDISVD